MLVILQLEITSTKENLVDISVSNQLDLITLLIDSQIASI